ncbi:hypothetical protein [Exilibacterium tricleocarpae]|uniref:hypothetical protein n=1 Tax=Exilibacterium tricleocarpae TaxID=2591008 RepID=UPI0015D2A76E|nr:hypothetical protein [Exilibacterium tricleocarpae]
MNLKICEGSLAGYMPAQDICQRRIYASREISAANAVRVNMLGVEVMAFNQVKECQFTGVFKKDW